MKTAILTATFYAHQGADRVMWQLADRIHREGSEVVIFTFSATMPPPRGVLLVNMGMPPGFTGQRLFHLLFPCNTGKGGRYSAVLREYDRIYTGPYPASWLAWLAKMRYGRAYTYYFFHFNLPGFVPGLAARLYTSLHVFAEKWTLRRAQKVITISRFSRESLKGIFSGDIEVEYCAVDCSRFRPGLDGSSIRTGYGFTGEPLVLCVGQLIPSKGMHLLIQAFREVQKAIPRAKLIIVGEPLYPGYNNKLRGMAGDSVIFVSGIKDEEMPLCYAACDVYATATLWEGFNLPLVEAQACGKPVVAFNTGPHPEVVEDGSTGFLVPPGDTGMLAGKIIMLLRDSGLRAKMGQAGAAMARSKFSIPSA